MNHFKLKNLDECYKYINDLEKIIDTLKLSEKKYRNLFDSIKEGIFLTNIEGKILESNQTYLNMLGYTSEEIKELTNQQLTPEIWRELDVNIVKNQIKISYCIFQWIFPRVKYVSFISKSPEKMLYPVQGQKCEKE